MGADACIGYGRLKMGAADMGPVLSMDPWIWMETLGRTDMWMWMFAAQSGPS